MVSFLLDNSLGAWWAAHRIGETDWVNAKTEEELRTKAALPHLPLTYLRFAKQDNGNWAPASGIFENWPTNLSEFKVIDPCCGSGHFLVAVLLTLVPIRMELESLTAREAVDRVLSENVNGLELDRRCVELAAFAVALTAWKYPNAGGYRSLPDLNIACSGLSVSGAKDEWKQLSLGKHDLRLALDWMHDAFAAAPTLGSLLDPAKVGASKIVSWKDLSSLLEQALKQEQTAEQKEAAVVAHGLAKASMLLAGQYNLVVTNVPYLARGKQDSILRDFCEAHYPDAKNDLATVFLQRCLELCRKGGTTSIVLPQNWLFLTSYKKLREKLLQRETWHVIARLGSGAFETISGEVVKAVLVTMSRGVQSGNEIHTPVTDLRTSSSTVKSPASMIRGLDVSEPRSTTDKAAALLTAEIKGVGQARQLQSPDARVTFDDLAGGELLSKYATAYWGQGTGDFARFGRYQWEVCPLTDDWDLGQTTIEKINHFSGRIHIVFWQKGKGELVRLAEELRHRLKNIHYRGAEAWGKTGISVTMMSALKVTLYTGQIFDGNCGSIIPKDPKVLPAIWCFCSSLEYNAAVRQIDQSLKVTNATLVKVPFDLGYWTQIANEKYPNGLPKPYSDDPTQWIFHGHPSWSEQPLQVAVVRLLGHRWPAELDETMELSVEARDLVNKSAELLAFADDDGIACIPSVRGEASAADRLHNLLATAYGDHWTSDKLAELLQRSEHGDKTLESWLREKFFTQHCQVFQHRPFIWHIWDGLRDGFAALVNYHKLDRKLLESLIYTYLGDWITRQKQDIERGIDGAQEKLSAAEQLQKRLELILQGESPYDIFIRWKAINQHPIGWEPDVNDGVRVNIRPFLTADVSMKGAGVLRDKPNINWNKDRGQDPESAPWYHLFKGDRINDHHLTLAEKLASRKHAITQVHS